MNNLKMLLKNSPITRNEYQVLKHIRDNFRNKIKFKYTGKYIDRSKGSEYLCIVLAGYKEFAYPNVFGRIKKYQREDMDICVISSGLYSEELDRICEKNSWSYLSTEQNNVCLVQNVAIAKHPNAKYIFKLDEDVFITENYFDNMMRAYRHAKSGKYNPGVMAPLLLVNGYSSARIIEKLNLVQIYEKKFGKFKYATGPLTQIESNPEFAKFMWGESDYVSNIDELNTKFSKQDLDEKPCPYRFSIGAILFEKSLWEEMQYFSVEKNSIGMGADEEQLDTYCFLHSKPLMVSENIVVGHLSFSKQNQAMKEYYQKYKNRFTY